MFFAGIKDKEERLNLIAYLKSATKLDGQPPVADDCQCWKCLGGLRTGHDETLSSLALTTTVFNLTYFGYGYLGASDARCKGESPASVRAAFHFCAKPSYQMFLIFGAATVCRYIWLITPNSTVSPILAGSSNGSLALNFLKILLFIFL